jgi:hypothetical protein
MEGRNLFSKVKYRWGSIIFVSLVTVATLAFCPIYLWRYGLTKEELAFFVFYALASSFSITLGYHRLFSHVAFKAAWPIRLLVLIFGGAAFEQSAMRWAALHRRHHRYTDTDLDPYDIKRGFFLRSCRMGSRQKTARRLFACPGSRRGSDGVASAPPLQTLVTSVGPRRSAFRRGLDRGMDIRDLVSGGGPDFPRSEFGVLHQFGCAYVRRPAV